MRLYDSHCHLADPRLDALREGVFARAAEVGIGAILGVSAVMHDWPRLWRLSRRKGDGGLAIAIALGLHPWFGHAPGSLARLPDWLERTGAVAVGECGLDFGPGRAPREVQEALLLPQLRLARERDLPVTLHAHKSEDVLAMHLARLPGLRGVVHGFHGSARQAERFLDLGFHVGFGAAITHPRATRLRALAAGLPPGRLLLESDAPDQMPHGREAPNEPAFLADALSVLAGLHDLSPEAMAAITWQNAAALFRFPGD
ncbi:MAG: TatD family hydrolase [Pseudomonadota bacterium]